MTDYRATNKTCRRCNGSGTFNSFQFNGVCLACGGCGKAEQRKFWFGVTVVCDFTGKIYKRCVRAYDAQDALVTSGGIGLRAIPIDRKTVDAFVRKFNQTSVQVARTA